MNKVLNWGVIGSGDVFEHKSGPSIVAAQRSHIASLMRRDKNKLDLLLQKFPGSLGHTDASAVIQDPAIDIIYIATPPSTHLEYVLQAAAAGKHILVEKPMGLHARESQTMIDACADAGVQLFVSYYRRFWPHIVAIKKMLDDGVIGNVNQAFFDFSTPLESGPLGWRLNKDINGGGYFVDMSTHRLDLLAYFLGTPTQIHGAHKSNDSGIELHASALIEFPNNTHAIARSDFASGRHADHFEIIGSTGHIQITNIGQHQFTIHKTNITPQTSEAFDYDAFPAPHLGLIEHIEDVLLDGANNLSSGHDGIITDRIVDEVLKR